MVYDPYTSPTFVAKNEKGLQPAVGSDTSLCLSCPDGTVAVGNTIVAGQVTMAGQMNSNDQFRQGTPNLMASHPQNMAKIQDAPDLVAGLASSGATSDPTGAVKLINGNIECTSCHNPHVQSKDHAAQYFLVKDGAQGSICLACHDPSRVVQGQTNPLAGWASSVHATSTATVQNLPYTNLNQNACLNCHQNHNAAGTDWVLRGAGDQVCLNCHSNGMGGMNKPVNTRLANGGMPALAGSSKVLARLDIAAEYAKIGHPAMLSVTPYQQRALSRTQDQPVGLAANAPSAGCIDCHSPHSIGGEGGGGTNAPAPAIRAAQFGATGISQTDGVTVVKPAQYQFQTCLRCHGSKAKSYSDSGKYGYIPLRMATNGNPLNLVPQFGVSAASSHPVFHPRNSSLPQPSLLQTMWDLNGTTPGRPMGTQILCTDCHNSDDNREFGGNGPNGPHGSNWSHILERRYEFSQAPAPGQPVVNPFPNPDLSANGPYALCGKCHNLANIMQNASFSRHAEHINAGFSCSTCHTAHGVASGSENTTGQRLVSFDTKVVAPNGGTIISYTRATGTCSLTCHGVTHNGDGKAVAKAGFPIVK
jgi:predicted CXXCH cytochrome family protein